MPPSFLTLAGAFEAEIRIRGSRFIAWAGTVEGESAARAAVEERSRVFFDATHHCAAWRFRDGKWRAVDAGEPSGSAGAPILAAIDARDLVDVVVVVTRYFGGTKLGVGGLVRAYGESAGAALDGAPTRRGIISRRVRILYPYALTAAIMRGLSRFHADSIEHGYVGDQAETTFALSVADLEGMAEMIQEETAGSVVLEPLEEMVFYRPEIA